ncbi:hypothetical protein EL22_00395 [Halostagnicola sp. A56]|uniref:hypothetical protein n=1 Tax=Halostagnicola sp. A56 TaxID=1495067 RepID=UPI0004A1988B|nr:hypothetical protein [Halostagnicola sp. A56]KDE59081.1 hypothetical protein EL22_00395 [Halostagnicola sp. A56]
MTERSKNEPREHRRTLENVRKQLTARHRNARKQSNARERTMKKRSNARQQNARKSSNARERRLGQLFRQPVQVRRRGGE